MLDDKANIDAVCPGVSQCCSEIAVKRIGLVAIKISYFRCDLVRHNNLNVCVFERRRRKTEEEGDNEENEEETFVSY
jgi:hypothetical protein